MRPTVEARNLEKRRRHSVPSANDPTDAEWEEGREGRNGGAELKMMRRTITMEQKEKERA